MVFPPFYCSMDLTKLPVLVPFVYSNPNKSQSIIITLQHDFILQRTTGQEPPQLQLPPINYQQINKVKFLLLSNLSISSSYLVLVSDGQVVLVYCLWVSLIQVCCPRKIHPMNLLKWF